MDQTKSRYYLFRTIEKDVVACLKQFKLGIDLVVALGKYHEEARDSERIPLSDSAAISFAKRHLAWKFFNEHDAIPSELVAKIRRMMLTYHMNYEEVRLAYVGRAYTDARARLVLMDLRSKGRA